MKKIKSTAEIEWRKQRQDERWEIRADWLLWEWRGVSVMLPRQMAHQNELNQDSLKTSQHS